MSARLRKIIIISLSATLVFFACYILVVKNLRHKEIIVTAKEVRLAKQLANKQTQIKQANLYKKHIKKLNQIYMADQTQLITITLPLLLDQLGKMAQSNQVTLQSLQPLPSQQQDQLVVHPLQFAIVGTYNQISQFVATLINAFSFVILQHIKLTKVRDNKLTMQTTCLVYGKKESETDD